MVSHLVSSSVWQRICRTLSEAVGSTSKPVDRSVADVGTLLLLGELLHNQIRKVFADDRKWNERPSAGILPHPWQVGSELRSAGGDSFYREILLMSLFYLIEEHNRVGAPWNSFERLACLLDVIPDTLHWG